MMRESKEKIKSRMIRNAARIWGFQEPQAESTFDPLVSLLLGACAFELEKISSEINNSESRIIERMVNILTPHPITSPHPSYAVAYARPYKNVAKVLPDYQFYAEVKIADRYEKKSEEKQVFFSPTGTFSLTNGYVRYIVANRKIYEIVDDQYKDIVSDKFKKSLSPSSLYLGLSLEERPNEITLFFNVINEHLRQAFFDELESCRWKSGNNDIAARKGITDLGKQGHDIYQLINRETDLSSKISHHVNQFFNRQFITLPVKDIDGQKDSGWKKIPQAFADSIDEKELSSLDDEITWIELQFNRPLSDELLESLTCSLNCFPVINRRLNEYTGSTRELINIIPLHTEDIFFDLKSVSNSKGEPYRINHFKSQSEITRGSALLRTDGVGRFDTRNAMEYLEYLLELLKEESAAFNIIGSDMIASNLRELNQTIARLEKKIEDVELEKGDTAYLMLKPTEGDRQVYVEFWSTNCTLANNIKAGSLLNVYRADSIDYNASRLMTTTTGGKEKPSTENRINAFRRSLQSGDRVVTEEDIKALCFEFMDDSVSQVEIEKGIEKGTGKSEGFIRTIDVYLTLNKGHELEPAERDSVIHELIVLLETRSSNIFPFRIFIRDKN
jgi:hypothetical protein